MTRYTITNSKGDYLTANGKFTNNENFAYTYDNLEEAKALINAMSEELEILNEYGDVVANNLVNTDELEGFEELKVIAEELQDNDPNGTWVEGIEEIEMGETTIEDMIEGFIECLEDAEEVDEFYADIINRLKTLQ